MGSAETSAQRREYNQRAQARHWYARYRAMLERFGCAESTDFDEFVSQCRAQGAWAMLTVLNRDDPTKLSYEPGAVLSADLQRRLGLVDLRTIAPPKAG